MNFHRTGGFDNYVNYGFSVADKVASQVSQMQIFDPLSVSHAPPISQRGSLYSLPPEEVNDDVRAIREEVSRSGRLFEDWKFPADDSSLFPSRPFDKMVVWKRPHEIVPRPKFFNDGATRFDVKQGELGDCWLLAAVSNLTLHPSLFNNIVSADQSFEENYIGLFYFRFWQYGKWITVAVDDKLPTVNGKLVFMHSADGEEFWSALFEKAYAKLHGSYEGLSGGRPCTAMDDFTGGVSEIFDLRVSSPNLFEIMLKGFQRGSLMACSIEPNPNVREQRCSNGLIRGHAYSITCVQYCQVSTPRRRERIPLIRVRNPWGNDAEWNGPWSDQSPEWRYVTDEERRNLGLNFEHDGEFWISYQDFIKNFDSLEMTNINLETLTEKDLNDHVTHKWEVKMFEGSWVRGATAGGCMNNPRTFWNNPKYFVTLKEEDDGDLDRKCTMIVALLQRPQNIRQGIGKQKFLNIGFSVHPVPPNIVSGGSLNEAALRATPEIKGLDSYANHRQVSFRYNLDPGTYCIIPSTYASDEEGKFILRVFCEKPNTASENDHPVGFVGINSKVASPHVRASSVDDETEARLRTIFDKIAGHDSEIDWKELQTLLNKRFETQFAFDGFSKSASRSMVAMLDFDKSGKLGFSEFVHIWNIICIWKKSFETHDKDFSGKLDGFEFRHALLASGFSLSNSLFTSLLTIYGDEHRQISFDDFVICAIRMSKAVKSFTDKDPTKTNSACFTLEEFMEHALCL